MSEERLQVVVTQDTLPGRPARPEVQPQRPPYIPNTGQTQRIIVPYGGSSEFSCAIIGKAYAQLTYASFLIHIDHVMIALSTYYNPVRISKYLPIVFGVCIIIKISDCKMEISPLNSFPPGKQLVDYTAI